jgi:hypothetical protein
MIQKVFEHVQRLLTMVMDQAAILFDDQSQRR